METKIIEIEEEARGLGKQMAKDTIRNFYLK
jgi:hypothetical protein